MLVKTSPNLSAIERHNLRIDREDFSKKLKKIVISSLATTLLLTPIYLFNYKIDSSIRCNKEETQCEYQMSGMTFFNQETLFGGERYSFELIPMNPGGMYYNQLKREILDQEKVPSNINLDRLLFEFNSDSALKNMVSHRPLIIPINFERVNNE